MTYTYTFLSYRHLNKHTHIKTHTVVDDSQTLGLLQGLWRRAPSMGQKTRPRISSWLWRNAWKYERRTAQKCLRWSRRCFMSPKKTSTLTWRQPSRLCWTGPPSGLQKSASQVSFISFHYFFYGSTPARPCAYVESHSRSRAKENNSILNIRGKITRNEFKATWGWSRE